MAKIIGIDLGTSNSAAAVMEGGRPRIIPSAEGTTVGGKAFPSYVAFTKDGQLLVGEPARRQAVSNPEGTFTAFKRKMGTDYKYKRPRQGVHAPAALRLHPAEDQAGRRGLPGREGREGGHHRPGLLQRQPAPGDQGRRRDRRPGGRAHRQRAHGRRLAYGLDKARRTRRSWSSTWAAGRSTSPSWTSAEGVFEVVSTCGDTQLGGTDMDESSSSSSPASSRRRPASTCTRTRWPCSACARQPRRPRSSSPPPWTPSSTCPSSPPTPTGRSTLPMTISRAKLEELVNPDQSSAASAR